MKPDPRTKLSSDEIEKLEDVLATARRWVRDYPKGHSLRRHAIQTLEYWGEKPLKVG